MDDKDAADSKADGKASEVDEASPPTLMPAGGSGGSPPPARPAAAMLHLCSGSVISSQISGSCSFGKAAAAATAAAAEAAAAAAAAAAAQPHTVEGRLKQSWKGVARLWWELPTACKATMLVACVNFFMSVIYVMVAVALTSVDEELHITIIILISAVFVVCSVADAIIYENTLELATSVIIDTLVLARVIFFAFEGSTHEVLKITWCSAMLVVQTIYIVVAILAYREFGWRLFSKLGVDFREKGAADQMRMAILRNSYATLLKVNCMLLVVLSALGIDGSAEKRGANVLEPLLAVSIAGLFVGAAATWLAVLLVLKPKQRAHNSKMLGAFHLLMPLTVAQPIATMVIYLYEANDVANAGISLRVSSIMYILFAVGVWVSTHLMYCRLERDRKDDDMNKAAVELNSGANVSVVGADPVLTCMHAGAWIGKPTARNPNKVRFFQLSYDGSTLRWGWNKFVRLYYIDDLACDDVELTMGMAFPFEAELVLKFKDAATYHAWRQGLAHLLLTLMAPDVLPPMETMDEKSRRPSGQMLLGNTSSRELFIPGTATLAFMTGSPAAAAAPAGPTGDAPLSSFRNSMRLPRMLLQLGARVQEMGLRLRPRRQQASLSLSQPGDADSASAAADRLRRRSEVGASSEAATGNDWDDEAATGVERAASGTMRQMRRKRSPSATQAQLEQARLRQEQEHSLQIEKRQRMASYLKSLAAAAHPVASHPQGRPPPVGAAAVATGIAAAAAAQATSQLVSSEASPEVGRLGGSGSRGSRGARLSADVGVQTDDSELQLNRSSSGGYTSLRRGSHDMSPLPPRHLQRLGEEEEAEPATPHVSPTSAAAPSSDGYGADLAYQYMAAMHAASGAAVPGAATMAAPATPAAQQQQAPVGGGDADVAAQYAAAIAAAVGAGGWAPAAAQQQAPGAGACAGGDSDVAAQYMAAMAAAAGGVSGAAPAAVAPPPQSQPLSSVVKANSDLAAQHLAAMQAAEVFGVMLPPHSSQQRGQMDGLMESWPRGSSRHLVPPPHRSTASTSASIASPLEQLAWQQQLAASARLTLLTSGSAPYSQGIPSAAGGGLWQLAAAVDVIDYEELSFGKPLGAGAEGAVYAARFLESPVAVKKFERAEDSLHEVEMYLQLGSHDNIVALRGLCQHEGSMFLVLEYCPRGTLDVMLHHSAKNPWDPQKLLPLVRSIARGMHYLHSRNVLHRDLKPANIFVGHGQMMKIGDFGMARIAAVHAKGPPNLRRLTPGAVGTVQYSAPELINEDLRPTGVDEMEWALKLDVWSFGVTLWEILERRRPFEGLTQNAVQARWMSDHYAARLPPVRLPESVDRGGKRIYHGLSDLIEDCTRLDPYARLTSHDILMRLKSLASFAKCRETSHCGL